MAASPEKGVSAGKESSGGLQKAFDAFAKMGGNKEGKVGGNTCKEWLEKAGICGGETGVTEDDVKKHLPKSCQEKDGGMDLKEFEQYIEKLAKEKKLDPKDLKKKLTSCMPSAGKAGEKMEDAKAKMPDMK